jgi:hypothetical protein
MRLASYREPVVAEGKLAAARDAPREKVAQVDKLAVALVLDVDDAVAVAPTADRLAVDYDILLAADDGERNHVADAGIERELLGVVLDRVVRVEPDRVVRELGADLWQGARRWKGKPSAQILSSGLREPDQPEVDRPGS